jgi:hypothetical protein
MPAIDDHGEGQMNPATSRYPPISDEECRLFEPSYAEAEVREDGGYFLVGDIQAPDGLHSKWPYRMLEERDTSHLLPTAVASIESLAATVIDVSHRPLRNRSEQTGAFRIVTAFATCGSHDRLISVKRRDEFKCPGGRSNDETTNLAKQVLDDYCAILKAEALDVTGVPLVCLEPELSRASERRDLVSEGISYAILIEESLLLSHVAWRPEHEMDALEPLSAATIIEQFSGSAGDGLAEVRIRDLRDTRSGARAGFEEYLYRVPGAHKPLYFVARAALSPSASPDERRKQARRLVALAAEKARRSCACALRAHEFHHPDDERYYSALRIVNHARMFDAGTEKSG